MPNTINDSLYLSDFQKQQKARNTGDLDKDAFLRILITQLQNQDPLNPMEDKEFIAQMAQFTSLEQMTNMNTNLQKFLDSHQNQFVSHSELIGKEVQWERERVNEDGSKRMEVVEGVVTSVKFQNGSASLVIDDQHTVSTKDIQVIKSAK
ncbi:flagellar hook assembly protein FlgD [Evansella cellulosilytica]|uniref:Flagellar hook capping protein n=1 Tax=Evansella cellulosilytica (strain ATCC 21833 / DSM 2522 / FERM P-1141 / JCM 9156 / N-4) TaxID=649639 RepID=E6TSW1_EVAC2|nr:flagellar hook assembly protein FlgD [Evansella cellulosilytica]ADU30753.1 flagellar hook capping protein [Evansella cellulosilytica DSM 2522]